MKWPYLEPGPAAYQRAASLIAALLGAATLVGELWAGWPRGASEWHGAALSAGIVALGLAGVFAPRRRVATALMIVGIACTLAALGLMLLPSGSEATG